MDLLLAMAILPAAALLYYVYTKDPVEKEPPKLLGFLLLFGAISVIPAIVLEMVLSNVLIGDALYLTMPQLVIENFIVVALVEEGCKFAFLNFKSWRDNAFDYIFDGIVYAVFVSLGFAIAENIMYVFQYGFGTALIRAVTAIPGHAVFGVFMGYFFGLAKYASQNGDTVAKLANLAAALIVPIFCHGMYDFLASLDGGFWTLMFFVFLVAMVFVGFLLVKKSAADAKRINGPDGGGGTPGEDSTLTDVHYFDEGMKL